MQLKERFRLLTSKELSNGLTRLSEAAGDFAGRQMPAVARGGLLPMSEKAFLRTLAPIAEALTDGSGTAKINGRSYVPLTKLTIYETLSDLRTAMEILPLREMCHRWDALAEQHAMLRDEEEQIFRTVDGPLVSVVVPAYKCASYLPGLFAWFLRQSLKEAELIIVDDGSPDETGTVTAKGMLRDGRIRYFRKENGGAGTARNFGLDKASGKYVIFLDADDVYADDLLTVLSENAERTGTDIVVCAIAKLNVRTGSFTRGKGYRNVPVEECFSFSEYLETTGKLPRINPLPQNKMYLRAFAQRTGVRFSSTRAGNDRAFFVCQMLSARRMLILPDKLVVHRVYQSADSITSNRLDRQGDTVVSSEEIFRFAQSEGMSETVMLYLAAICAIDLDYNMGFGSSDSFLQAERRLFGNTPWNAICRADAKRAFRTDGREIRREIRRDRSLLKRAVDETTREGILFKLQESRNRLENLRCTDEMLGELLPEDGKKLPERFIRPCKTLYERFAESMPCTIRDLWQLEELAAYAETLAEEKKKVLQ